MSTSVALTAEQQTYKDMARKFAREEIMPVAAEFDRSGEYPMDLIKKAWSLGLMNPAVPQDCGMLPVNVFASKVPYGCSLVQVDWV